MITVVRYSATKDGEELLMVGRSSANLAQRRLDAVRAAIRSATIAG